MDLGLNDAKTAGEAKEIVQESTSSVDMQVSEEVSEQTTIEVKDEDSRKDENNKSISQTKPSNTETVNSKNVLDKRDLKKVFDKLRQLKEQNYSDKIGKNEGKFYAQSKINDKHFIPDISKLKTEILEEEIPSELNEFGEEKTDIVRTLDDFAFYDKFGNLIKLIDILEKPYYDFQDDLIGYGTVCKPLPEELSVQPITLSRDSDRSIVRAMLERAIPRGFRQSEFCTASPKNFKPKKKSSKQPKTVSASNLNFTSPHYVPGVSREDAHAKAAELLSSVELPLKVGTIRVVHLGEICEEKGYHNQKHLYPIGYTSERQYTSVLDPGIKVKYTSEILRGPNGPLFKVTHEGGTPYYEAATSSAVWLKILKALNERKVQLGLPPKGTAISGPEMMGFAHKKIAAVIEGLDGVLNCGLYLFRAQRIESGAPKRKYAQMNTNTASPSSSLTQVSMEVEEEKSTKSPSKNTVDSEANDEHNVFDENDSFTSKRQKVVHIKSEETTKFSSGDIEKVKRLSKMLSLLTTNEEKQIYQTLLSLKTVPVDFDILYRTGLGKVVNRLRKHASTEVASLAKQLKKKWVKETNEDTSVSLTPEDRAVVKKACYKIVSYVGFGDDEPPFGFRSHNSKNAPRKKLLDSLNSLDQDFASIPVDVLVDTNVGARVNKLRKHLDEDIQMVALKLKGKWKKQIADEEEKQNKLIEQVKSGQLPASSVVVSTRRAPRSSLAVERFTFDQSIDIVKSENINLSEYQTELVNKTFNEHLQNSVRVKLEKIKGVRITHNDSQRDATLWLVTERARYRLCGERCASMPSFRYYYFFKDAFHAFQSAVYTMRLVNEEKSLDISTIPPGLSQNAVKRAKLRIMLMSASKIIKMSTRCPCPEQKKLKVLKTEKNRRLNFDILAASYETILDEITRVGQSEEEIKNILQVWFIDVLISRGNCYHAKSKKESIKIEKDFFKKKGDSDEQPTIFKNLGGGNNKKARILAGKKMVKEGINLPDDFEIVFDDKLPEKLQRFGFLPKENREFAPSYPPTQLSSIPELSVLDMKVSLKGSAIMKKPSISSQCFGSLLFSWLTLVKISDEVEILDKASGESFLIFRKQFYQGKVHTMFCSILQFLLESDTSIVQRPKSDQRQISDQNKSSTRSSAANEDNPQNFTVTANEIPSYVYNKDEFYPYPPFAVTSASWPEVLKRLLARDVVKQSEKALTSQNGLITSHFALDSDEIYPNPDLLTTCIDILNRILDLPVAAAFSNPVNTAEYSNYLDIVKRPMDLNTVKQRIENGHYETSKLPFKDAYASELAMPTVQIEPKQTNQGEDSDAEESGNEANEEKEDNDEEVQVTDINAEQDGRIMKYFIKRKMRKAGKWRFKTEFQLQSELRHKITEIEELTCDEKYYVHDCVGAGYNGVLADVRQVWRNCRKFNRSSTRIFSDCEKLETAFMRMFEKQVIQRDYKNYKANDTHLQPQVKNEDQSHGCEYSHLQLNVPTLVEVYREFSNIEFALLPVEFKVVLLEWLVNKLLETPKVRTLIVSKQDIIQQIEREETLNSKVPPKSDDKKSDNDFALEQQHRKEIYLQNYFEHCLNLDIIGEDRYYNRYYGIYPLVKQSGWILKEEVKSGEWSVIHNEKQMNSLLSRLDIRGCRENKLNQRLVEYWLPVWKNSIQERDERAKKYIADFEDLSNQDSLNVSKEQQELQEKLLNMELRYREISPEASKWLTATAENGSEYYYHEITRKSTWDKPVLRTEMETLKEHIEDLKTQLLETSQSPEEKVQALVDEITHDGDIYCIIRSEKLKNTVVEGSLGENMALFYFRNCVVSLCARMQSTEKLTLGPSCAICYSQRHSQWCEKARDEWYRAISELLRKLNIKMKQQITSRKVGNPQGNLDNSVDGICSELVDEVASFGSRGQRNRLLANEVKEVGWSDTWRHYTFDGYISFIEDLKQILLSLYSEFEGSPYSVDTLKAQEGILQATRHYSRWKRALGNAKNLSEIGLLEAHLCELIGLTNDPNLMSTIEGEIRRIHQECLQI